MPPFFKALTVLHLVAAAMIWIVAHAIGGGFHAEPFPPSRVLARLVAVEASASYRGAATSSSSGESPSEAHDNASTGPAEAPAGAIATAGIPRRDDPRNRSAPWDATTGRLRDGRDALPPWRESADGRVSLRY